MLFITIKARSAGIQQKLGHEELNKNKSVLAFKNWHAPRIITAQSAHKHTDGVLFQLHSARARRERINKALQCIGVTKLAVFHNRVFQSSYQLETIKRAIHHSYKAARVRGATLTGEG